MLLYSNLPTMPLTGLRREVDRMFDDVFGRVAANGTGAWAPAVDAREDDRGFVFELEIPGVAPDKVEVTADNGILTVRGEKASERTANPSDRWHLAERTHGAFSRSFQLPSTADEGAIDASFAHGVLTIRIQKVAKPEPRRIEVRQN